MKILVTASTFPRWKHDSIPEFILHQLKALKKEFSELDLHVLVPHDFGAPEKETINGIQIYRFKYFWPAKQQKLVYPAILPNIRTNKSLLLQVPFLLFFETLAVYQLCKALKPDLLYSHWFVPQVLAGGSVAMLLKIKHVFTSHSSDIQIMRYIPVLGPMLVRFFIRRMVACTVVSKRSYKKLESFFSHQEWKSIREKVKIIPMGVNRCQLDPTVTENVTEIKVQLGIPKKKIILFLGRFSYKKGLFFLIDAYAGIMKEMNNTVLIMAGDGELFSPLAKEIEQRGLKEHIKMVGYVTGNLKEQYLKAADILVVPSIITKEGDAEGLPVSLLEGMATGKICVATDVSGADDIILHGQNGFLVPSQNSSRLAQQLKQVLNLPENEIEVISNNARKCADGFDWGIIAREYYEHLFKPVRA